MLKRLLGPALMPNRFDLRHGINGARIIAGMFYFPHLLSKLRDLSGSADFFASAGLHPAWLFLTLAIIVEASSGIALVLGLFTRWAGLLSAGAMAVAIYAVFATDGIGWYWAGGGVEYLVFWGLLSIAISYDAWNR